MDKVTMGTGVLDRFLAGGIPCKSITELVGESSSGKTQWCLQLTITTQLPTSQGGLSGSAIFINTDFHFPLKRLKQLVKSFQSAPHYMLPVDPLANVFVHNVEDANQLVNVLTQIKSCVCRPTNELPIRLIVIDSIASLFRSQYAGAEGFRLRASLYSTIGGRLRNLADGYNIAVVVTNQVADVVWDNGGTLGNFQHLVTSGRKVCAALGRAWGNCVNSRLFLSRYDEVVSSGSHPNGGLQRKWRVEVEFAANLPQSSSEFAITAHGVYGVEVDRH